VAWRWNVCFAWTVTGISSLVGCFCHHQLCASFEISFSDRLRGFDGVLCNLWPLLFLTLWPSLLWDSYYYCYCYCTGQPLLVALPDENWRILLEQNFTALMPLLTVASAFELESRYWISRQRCYLHCLRTIALKQLIQVMSGLKTSCIYFPYFIFVVLGPSWRNCREEDWLTWVECVWMQWAADVRQSSWSRHSSSSVLWHHVHIWLDARDEKSQVRHEVCTSTASCNFLYMYHMLCSIGKYCL